MSEFVVTEFGDRVAFDRYEAARPTGGTAGADGTGDTGGGIGGGALSHPGAGGGAPAPVVVFVAGVGPYRAIDPITGPTAEALAAAGITSIVYDRIGRGESVVATDGSAPAGPITLEREFAAIRALIAAATESSSNTGPSDDSGSADAGSDESGSGRRAVLVGHSSGCSIALAAAAAGAPVAGLVLWEAPLGGITGGTQAWADEIGRLAASGDLEGALVHYMKDMPPQWLEGARRSPMFAGMVAQVGSQLPDAESLAWADSAPLAQLVGDLAIPVEAVYGEQTQPIMVSAAEAIAAAIPGATAKRMPGANHSWEPPAMAAELAAFMHSRVFPEPRATNETPKVAGSEG